MNLNVLSNIKKAITDIWIEIYDIYPNLLSSPEWVLTNRQKELWVVCVDIWASTTWVTVYENWVLSFSSIIPLGWDNVTNDIALWLRTSTSIAERTKLEYAELDLEEKEWFSDSEFDLTELDMWEEWRISRLYLSRIVSARYDEIFYFVREELRKIWKDGMLPEWAVCVWWWAKMKWFVEFAKKSLKLPVFIWLPVSKDDLIDASISDPLFSAVIWTMIFSNMYSNDRKMFSINFSWFFQSIKKLFKKILP
jgi:cell division protein FtsA